MFTNKVVQALWGLGLVEFEALWLYGLGCLGLECLKKDATTVFRSLFKDAQHKETASCCT